MNTHTGPRTLMVAEGCHPTEIAQMEGLRQDGVDLRAVVSPDCPYIDDIRARGIPLEVLRLRGHLDFSAARHLRHRIRDEGLQLVHALTNKALSTLFWASIGQPVKLVAYRGAIGHVHRLDPGAWLKWYNPRIDRIVCVSDAVRTDLMKSGVPANRLLTIYKGHELEWYENRAAADLQSFGISRDAFVVGCVANMRPVKGVDVLVRAMARLDRSLNIHALLVGDVRDDRIPRLIDTLGLEDRVHLAGYRSDAVDLIGACDVVVAPSRGREGLTKSVIEGMVQGHPAIVTDAGGLPEMVDEGISGYVIRIDDEAALADRIARLAANPEQTAEMGQRARDIVKTRFSVKETVARTLALYNELLAA